MGNPTDQPRVSVILPIRNESAFIEQVLWAILNQDYTGELEILVADGCSVDSTRSIVQKFIDHRDETYQKKDETSQPRRSINIINNPQKVVSTGFNIALRRSSGEIIVRVDGHTLIAPDYVRQCVRAIQRSGADNVGGRMVAIGKTQFGIAVAIATSTPFGIGNSHFHYSKKDEWVDSVYLGAWPRKIFELYGFFDEEMVRNQDDEFNYRIREFGGKILLCQSIISEYIVRSTPKALWTQYFQYGYWKIRVLQKHPRQMSLRQFVPPLFVIGLLASLGGILIAIIIHSKTLAWLSLIVPLLYLLSNFSASVFLSVKNKSLQNLLIFPVVFAILHISYGTGFLTGFVKFFKHWRDNS